MILSGVDLVQERDPAELDEEFRVRKGDFIGVVEPHDNQYKFFVRDVRRERPTIHGFGVDFPQAVTTVAQLLNSLNDS